MKTNRKSDNRHLVKRIALSITFAVLFFGISTAQEPAKDQEKSPAVIQLSFYKNADKSKTAVAIAKTKNKDGKFIFAKDVKVNFYATNGKELQLIKSVITDNNGKASIGLPKEIPLDDSLYFSVTAKIENDNMYEDAEDNVRFKEANVSISLDPHDTSQLVTAKVTDIGKDGKERPVKGVEVSFYVQRLFGLMPAGEDYKVTTDKSGEAEFNLPKNIAGDTAGDLIIVTKLEDNAIFGNVENKAATTWGTVLAIEKDPFPRALWKPYAPLPLVFTITILFGGVWIVYFFLFVQMRKIYKEGKKSKAGA